MENTKKILLATLIALTGIISVAYSNTYPPTEASEINPELILEEFTQNDTTFNNLTLTRPLAPERSDGELEGGE